MTDKKQVNSQAVALYRQVASGEGRPGFMCEPIAQALLKARREGAVEALDDLADAFKRSTQPTFERREIVHFIREMARQKREGR